MKKVWVIIRHGSWLIRANQGRYYREAYSPNHHSTWQDIEDATQYESESAAEDIVRTFIKGDGSEFAFEIKQIIVWNQ